MNKHTTSQRIQRSLASGIAFFAVSGIAYKLGFRGKHSSGDTFTTWSELAGALPSLVVLSALVAGMVYFWLSRNES